MSHFHAVVWIDHRQARVFHIGASGADEAVLRPHAPERHIHHKANAVGSGHAQADRSFMEAVVKAVEDAGEILIIGPAGAKTELAKYLRSSRPEIGRRIVGVEPADHPTDGEIVALARHHFRLAEPPRA